MTLPARYSYLANEPGPKMVLEALKLFGLTEGKGPANNPTIVLWAAEVAQANPTVYNKWATKFYSEDSIAWCGLFMAICAVRSAGGKPERLPPDKYLSALSWAKWGKPVPKTGAMLGDVLTFQREGGGHVGLYVGEDADCFHVLGGNQSDAVTITRILKSRLFSVARPAYTVQPDNVRKIKFEVGGPVSINET
jgi:uncharacterized protein (TIGR02594 family)